MLQLWIENDGRTAHLVNEAGLPVVTGALVPEVDVVPAVNAIREARETEAGAAPSVTGPTGGIRVSLIFEGRVV